MADPRAALIAVLLPGIAYVSVVALTERVFWDTSIPPGREQRAALAIRDNVIPFQKWGSKQFTIPYLKKHYGAAWYFTQTAADDCKEAFLARLNEACERYAVVDLFILAHGNQLIRWVAELPAPRRSRIRLVYNTGCRDLGQGPAWLSLGVKAYVGHPGDSASPVFYFYFLRRWTRGMTLDAAVEESNGLMRSALAKAEFFSLAALDAGEIFQDSEAFCYGDGGLRFEGNRD
jgi:ActR/RegA family two-component response regulator